MMNDNFFSYSNQEINDLKKQVNVCHVTMLLNFKYLYGSTYSTLPIEKICEIGESINAFSARTNFIAVNFMKFCGTINA